LIERRADLPVVETVFVVRKIVQEVDGRSVLYFGSVRQVSAALRRRGDRDSGRAVSRGLV